MIKTLLRSPQNQINLLLDLKSTMVNVVYGSTTPELSEM